MNNTFTFKVSIKDNIICERHWFAPDNYEMSDTVNQEILDIIYDFIYKKEKSKEQEIIVSFDVFGITNEYTMIVSSNHKIDIKPILPLIHRTLGVKRKNLKSLEKKDVWDIIILG